jgi:hypothetical protein
MPSRRSLLALLAGLAGCSSHADPATPTLTPAPAPTPASPTPSPTRTDILAERVPKSNGETTLTPRTAGIRRSFFYEVEEAYAVGEARSGRYLFVFLRSEGPKAPEVADFRLRFGGETLHATTDPADYSRRATWRRLDGFGFPYSGSERSAEVTTEGGWVAFAVPTGSDARRGRFGWFGDDGWTEWPLSADSLARLNAPLAHFEPYVRLPTEISSDEVLTVVVEARNRGEGAGTFRVAINLTYRAADRDHDSHDSARGSRRLAPGTTWRWEYPYSDHIATGTDEIAVEIATAARTIRETVAVRD